jgi:hypothetical protein
MERVTRSTLQFAYEKAAIQLEAETGSPDLADVHKLFCEINFLSRSLEELCKEVGKRGVD